MFNLYTHRSICPFYYTFIVSYSFFKCPTLNYKVYFVLMWKINIHRLFIFFIQNFSTWFYFLLMSEYLYKTYKTFLKCMEFYAHYFIAPFYQLMTTNTLFIILLQV